MSIGLLGKKLGMTHVYDEYGRRLAVTAVQAGPCMVLQFREPDRHGYQAVQVGFEPIKESRLRKPELGQFKKAGTSPFRFVREFRVPPGVNGGEWKVGQPLTVELFKAYELVDVTGVSIGKGFQGGMKRWHWKGGPKTHGSTSHRRPGSIGSTTTPGRVFRGHHLPGHMGNARVTVQNVRIVKIDLAHHLLLIEGAIPGVEQQLVMVRKSIKRPDVIRKPQAFQTIVEEEELSKTAKAIKAKPK
ncbi:MAG: 50S ribosomal protein L3 [Candidatus Omnitrophica bacterium]|nr:50S ribosomal protein L3 [Candidatus Omnitrophota bacterium]MBI3083164.1 50S ribosomal protein L3 [Candidatus Omnitrophota bacterium]